MKCPFCSKPGLRKLKGYCCKAHRKLHRRPPKKAIQCSGGCGLLLRRAPSSISVTGKVYCKNCKRAKGEAHYRYADGSYVDKAGYRMILRNNHYMKEHRLRWEEANEACLLTSGTIHHVRFDLPHNKTYNDPDNLLLLSDVDHGRFHRLLELGRLDEAFAILKKRAVMQLHYPAEVDNFIQAILDTQD